MIELLTRDELLVEKEYVDFIERVIDWNKVNEKVNILLKEAVENGQNKVIFKPELLIKMSAGDSSLVESMNAEISTKVSALLAEKIAENNFNVSHDAVKDILKVEW